MVLVVALFVLFKFFWVFCFDIGFPFIYVVSIVRKVTNVVIKEKTKISVELLKFFQKRKVYHIKEGLFLLIYNIPC